MTIHRLHMEELRLNLYFSLVQPLFPEMKQNPVALNQTRELISARKTSHKHSNKDLSRLLTWHVSKYKVGLHKLHQSYILCKGRPFISGTLGDTGVYKHDREPVFFLVKGQFQKFINSHMFCIVILN